MVDDIVTESARKSTPSSSRRSVVEVVTRDERRRRWSQDDCARRIGVSTVARTFGSIFEVRIRAKAIRAEPRFCRIKLFFPTT